MGRERDFTAVLAWAGCWGKGGKAAFPNCHNHKKFLRFCKRPPCSSSKDAVLGFKLLNTRRSKYYQVRSREHRWILRSFSHRMNKFAEVSDAAATGFSCQQWLLFPRRDGLQQTCYTVLRAGKGRGVLRWDRPVCVQQSRGSESRGIPVCASRKKDIVLSGWQGKVGGNMVAVQYQMQLDPWFSSRLKLVMKAEQTSDHMSGGTQELHSHCCSN
ncbi:uncharacterized protein LOC128787811 [Vidua chalybeata]|uniref:uncharacterized protein LOC128787811 n=1 Tax=Vidua chalybeata TaxID=81927 RepID=UPI0023A90629|nr:uncharacterized protein LOC128787811 [Vidua chalybeata]